MLFAKELFKIWDEDDSGKLDIDELTLPLIALGLSNDSSFVQKLIKSIDEEKFLKGNQKISIKDFVKIFKTDYFSDKAIQIIKETIDKSKAQKLKLEQRKTRSSLAKDSFNMILPPPPSDLTSLYKLEDKSSMGASFLLSRDARRTTAPSSLAPPSRLSHNKDLPMLPQPSHLSKYRSSNRSSKKLQPTHYTLNDLLQVIRQWWTLIDHGRGNLTQPIDQVAKVLVEQKLTSEADTAKRLIWEAIKKEKQEIDWEDFNQIFCKGVFKEVLVSLAN